MLLHVKKETRTPVCVGFGISTPADAKAAVKNTDGIIVGSAVVRALAANPTMKAEAFAARFIKPFSKAIGKD